jgi:hypothetical protein
MPVNQSAAEPVLKDVLTVAQLALPDVLPVAQLALPDVLPDVLLDALLAVDRVQHAEQRVDLDVV